MTDINLVYLPIVGRGPSNKYYLCNAYIKVNLLMSKPMGEDFDKDTQLLLERYHG